MPVEFGVLTLDRKVPDCLYLALGAPSWSSMFGNCINPPSA